MSRRAALRRRAARPSRDRAPGKREAPALIPWTPSFGWALCDVGDVDGDGASDFVVGAPSGTTSYVDGTPRRTFSSLDPGSAWLLSGRDLSPIRAWAGHLPRDEFAYSVEAARDLDSDGRADVLVGAPGAGSMSAFSTAYGKGIFTVHSEDPDVRFGHTLRSVDDMDGDGHEDFLIGAPAGAKSKDTPGKVVVVSGRTRQVVRTIAAPDGDASFGFSVVGGLRIDGDGIPEVVVGSPFAKAAHPGSSGEVRVFSGHDGRQLARIRAEEHRSSFGFSLCLVADLDGDGREDLAVGAPAAGTERGGVVDVLSTATWKPLRTFGNERGEVGVGWYDDENRFGYSLSASGDLDGHGARDLVVGAPTGFWQGGRLGWAEAFSGRDGHSLRKFAWKGDGWAPSLFGNSVTITKGMDRDALSDVLIGAPSIVTSAGLQVASGGTGEVREAKIADLSPPK